MAAVDTRIGFVGTPASVDRYRVACGWTWAEFGRVFRVGRAIKSVVVLPPSRRVRRAPVWVACARGLEAWLPPSPTKAAVTFLRATYRTAGPRGVIEFEPEGEGPEVIQALRKRLRRGTMGKFADEAREFLARGSLSPGALRYAAGLLRRSSDPRFRRKHHEAQAPDPCPGA